MNREQRRELKICLCCNQPSAEGKARCEKHLASGTAAVKKYLSSEKGKQYLKNTESKRKLYATAYKRKQIRGRGRFSHAKSNAHRRGKDWNISEQEWLLVIDNNCRYCEFPNDHETGSGLDRIDNSKGYLLDNVVSCCADCNLTRGNRYTFEEMILLGKVIKSIKQARLINGG